MDHSDPAFHGYVTPQYLGPNSLYQDYDSLFHDAREGATPQITALSDNAVTNGGYSFALPFGFVQNHVDRDDGLIANVTTPYHLLHPGLVVKLVDQNDEGTHVVTLGIGNGALPTGNEWGAPPMWLAQNVLVGVENVLETNVPIWHADDVVPEYETPAYRLAEMFTGHAYEGYVANPDWARTAENAELLECDYYGFDLDANAPTIDAGNLDASIYWAHDYLTERGVDTSLSGEARSDVAQMYDAATGDAALQSYLQDTDYHLAEQEMDAGAQNVAPVVGASMAPDLSAAEAMPEDPALYDGITPAQNSMALR